MQRRRGCTYGRRTRTSSSRESSAASSMLRSPVTLRQGPGRPACTTLSTTCSDCKSRRGPPSSGSAPAGGASCASDSARSTRCATARRVASADLSGRSSDARAISCAETPAAARSACDSGLSPKSGVARLASPAPPCSRAAWRSASSAPSARSASAGGLRATPSLASRYVSMSSSWRGCMRGDDAAWLWTRSAIARSRVWLGLGLGVELRARGGRYRADMGGGEPGGVERGGPR